MFKGIADIFQNLLSRLISEGKVLECDSMLQLFDLAICFFSYICVQGFCILLLLSAFAFSAQAEEGSTPPAAGQCGEAVTWAYDPVEGALVISGTGPMYDSSLPNSYGITQALQGSFWFL